MPVNNQQWSKDAIIDQIEKRIDEVLSNDVTYDFSPVLHKYVSAHAGIKAYGKFKTTDASDNGQMSYITFWRNQNVAVPYDGVGMAWRKGDGTKYNVYLVDNDALSENVLIGEKIIREDLGVNNYIASTKHEILEDTWYNFSVQISSNYSIIAKIWDIGNSEPSDDAAPDSSYIVLKTGAKSAPYRTEDPVNYQFGIGVINTKGQEWYYDDLVIQDLSSGSPFNIFKFKADSSDFSTSGTLYYYGYGYDDTPTYGITAYVLNSSGTWVSMGTNTSNSGTAVEDTEIKFEMLDISEYRYNGYIYMAVRPTNIIGAQTVRTYYTKLENIIPAGVSEGGKLDVYIEDPTSIVETEVSKVIASGKIIINNTVFNTPIQEIVDITNVANEVLSDEDWTLVTSEIGSAYSYTPNQYISFGGSYAASTETVTIRYRYLSNGSAIKSLLVSDDYRNPGMDLKVKVTPPYRIIVNSLEYSGLAETTTIKEAIKTFVNGLDSQFQLSDFLNAVYTAGADYVNLDTLDVVVKGYDYKNTLTTGGELPITNSYTISGLGAFYTHTQDLIGVSRIDQI